MARFERCGQAVEGAHHVPLQPRPLRRDPVGIALGQQLALVRPRHRFESARVPAGEGAALAGPATAAAVDAREGGAKVAHVRCHRRAQAQRHVGTALVECVVGAWEVAAQVVELAPEVRARLSVRRFRPQRGGEPFARHPFASGEDEKRQQLPAAGRHPLRGARAVYGQPEPPQEIHPQLRGLGHVMPPRQTDGGLG